MEVWRSRVFPYETCAIEYICFAPTAVEPRLLVCRLQGSLELWDTKAWQVRYAVPGHDMKYSVRSVAWFPKEDGFEEAAEVGVGAFYIYTAGFGGHITQWDAATLLPLSHVDGGGGKIWTLTSMEETRQLAIGCNDGTLRIFNVPEDGSPVEYSGRHIQVSSEKIISSCRVEKHDMYIGQVDGFISRWSLKRRTCEAKIALQRRDKTKALCWSLVLLPAHGVVASGDSFGLVCLWDCITHVLVQRFQHHQADVLTLSINAEGSYLVAGSADARIAIFSAQSSSPDQRFDFVRSVTDHENDVRTVCVDPLLEGEFPMWVSGGTQGALFAHRHNSTKRCSIFSPFFHAGAVAPTTQLVACQGFNSLEIWYLPAPDKQGNLDDVLEQGYVPCKEDLLPRAQYIMSIKRSQSQKPGLGHRHLIASHIRADGGMIALSDVDGTRLFHINVVDLAVKQVRVPGAPSNFRNIPCRALRFCGPGNSLLAAATFQDHRILFVDPAKGVIGSMEEHQHPVHLMEANGEWLVSADSSGAVHLTNLDSFSHFARVPTSSAKGVFPTAVAVNHQQLQLFIALSNHKVLVYKIEEEHVAPAAKLSGIEVPKPLLREEQRISGITLLLERPDRVLLWGESFLLVMNLQMAESAGKKTSAKEMTPSLAPDRITTIGAFRLYPRFKHMISFCSVPTSEWGDPILANRAVTPMVRKRKAEDGKAENPERVAKVPKVDIKHVVLSLEISPERMRETNPASFERKTFQEQNLHKKKSAIS